MVLVQDDWGVTGPNVEKEKDVTMCEMDTLRWFGSGVDRDRGRDHGLLCSAMRVRR